MGFRTYKIWQILKRFARTFCQAQTLKLGGLVDMKNLFDSKRWLKFNDDALEGLSFLKKERRKNLDLESNSWNLFFKSLKKMD